MKIVIAMDSFKGSLNSVEAGNAVRNGIRKAKQAAIIVSPISDGGEGTVEALIYGLGGQKVSVTVAGPLGHDVVATYGIIPDRNLAVMEMAQAAGITLVDELDPWGATTYGVGQMILDAIEKGCREFVIGIGGSATSEAGIGMLTALGYEFYDFEGKQLLPVLESLEKIARIDDENVNPILKESNFKIVCDVTNPLCGKEGAAYIFGPQKGIKDNELEKADRALANFAQVVTEYFEIDNSRCPGAGAAGGLGFAFLSFFKNSSLQSGIDIMVNLTGLDGLMEGADIVVTGEGKMDGQTAMGKVPVGVAKIAKKYDCKVIAIAGCITEDARECNKCGIDAIFPIAPGPISLDEAMDKETAKKNLMNTAEQIFRLL